jgi:hypothetical protein
VLPAAAAVVAAAAAAAVQRGPVGVVALDDGCARGGRDGGDGGGVEAGDLGR